MTDTFEQTIEKAANSLWASEKYTEAEKEKFPVSWYDTQQRARKLLLDIGLGPDKVVVPREPTEAMRSKGGAVIEKLPSDLPSTWDDAKEVYCAMIAAAEGKSNG